MTAHSVLAFFLLHLVVGTFLPLAKNVGPFFFALIEHAGVEISRRLNRQGRGKAALFLRGVVVAVIMTGFSAVISYAVWHVMQYPYGWAIGAVFLFSVASVMMPLTLLREMLVAFEKGDMDKVISYLQPYFQEPLQGADTFTLVRKATEMSAVMLNIYFVGPLFWFGLLGAPGAMAYVTFSALARAFGRSVSFGAVVRWVDAILNTAPALITSFILAFSAIFVSRSNPVRSFGTVFRQAGRYKVPCLGWPIAAMAGSLGVTLCGPVRYADDSSVDHGWIGPTKSTARLTLEDLQRCAMLHFVFFLCVMTFFAFGVVMYQFFS